MMFFKDFKGFKRFPVEFENRKYIKPGGLDVIHIDPTSENKNQSTLYKKQIYKDLINDHLKEKNVNELRSVLKTMDNLGICFDLSAEINKLLNLWIDEKKLRSKMEIAETINALILLSTKINLTEEFFKKVQGKHNDLSEAMRDFLYALFKATTNFSIEENFADKYKYGYICVWNNETKRHGLMINFKNGSNYKFHIALPVNLELSNGGLLYNAFCGLNEEEAGEYFLKWTNRFSVKLVICAALRENMDKITAQIKTKEMRELLKKNFEEKNIEISAFLLSFGVEFWYSATKGDCGPETFLQVRSSLGKILEGGLKNWIGVYMTKVTAEKCMYTDNECLLVGNSLKTRLEVAISEKDYSLALVIFKLMEEFKQSVREFLYKWLDSNSKNGSSDVEELRKKITELRKTDPKLAQQSNEMFELLMREEEDLKKKNGGKKTRQKKKKKKPKKKKPALKNKPQQTRPEMESENHDVSKNQPTFFQPYGRKGAQGVVLPEGCKINPEHYKQITFGGKSI